VVEEQVKPKSEVEKEARRTPSNDRWWQRALMIRRRDFVCWVLGLPLLSLFPFRVVRLPAQTASDRFKNDSGAPNIGERFAGEELHYDISFWIIKRVAVAKLSFNRAEQKGLYIATLQGETVGILGFLARYRVDTYYSLMEEVDGGKRLRSLSFDEYVKVGSRVRKNLHTFDHQRRKWVHRSSRRDGTMETMEKEIPEGQTYDDFLAAAYNFRCGIYGTVERGKTYNVATFPRKGTGVYEVKVVSKAEEDRRRRSEGAGEEEEYAIDLKFDPDIINSKEGVIEGWLSKEFYPVEGTIKDVILFGDVQGRLVKRSIKKEPSSPAAPSAEDIEHMLK
jgi:hypothetical protein